MPRPGLPTPGSSLDIKGKDGSRQLSSLQTSFELPPPALAPSSASAGAHDLARVSPVETKLSSPNDLRSTATGPHSPPKTPFVQASEAVKSRRRSSTNNSTAASAQKPLPAQESSFALPPPPTRSRKIIQMKMKPAAGAGSSGGSGATAAVAETAETATGKSGKMAATTVSTAGAGGSASSTGAAAATSVAATASSTTTTGGRKKQPSATSAAGRKIARKTAHSLIERRRRSKMNEEFAVLKSMIPACTGEMHKLAILQASIEYVRYLEDCVSKLKAQQQTAAHANSASTDFGHSMPSGHFRPSTSVRPDDASGDIEMTDSELPSPAFSPPTGPIHAGRSNQPSVSPALLAQDSRQRHESYSSASTPAEHRHESYSSASTTADHRHYSYSTSSATTSPNFGPQTGGTYQSFGGPPSHHGSLSAAGSTLTSPALGPQRDLDQEATAALLMLNSDRRRASTHVEGRPPAVGAGRGMSVRDLLST